MTMHKLKLMYTKYEVIPWKHIEVISIFMGGIFGGHPVLKLLCYISIYADMCANVYCCCSFWWVAFWGVTLYYATSVYMLICVQWVAFWGVSLYYATPAYTLICIQGSACIMLHQHTRWYVCRGQPVLCYISIHVDMRANVYCCCSPQAPSYWAEKTLSLSLQKPGAPYAVYRLVQVYKSRTKHTEKSIPGPPTWMLHFCLCPQWARLAAYSQNLITKRPVLGNVISVLFNLHSLRLRLSNIDASKQTLEEFVSHVQPNCGGSV